MRKLPNISDAAIDRAAARLRASGVIGVARPRPGTRDPAPLTFDDRVNALNRRGKAPAAALRALRRAGRRTTSK